MLFLRFTLNATEGNLSSLLSKTESQLIGRSGNDKLIISQTIISKEKVKMKWVLQSIISCASSSSSPLLPETANERADKHHLETITWETRNNPFSVCWEQVIAGVSAVELPGLLKIASQAFTHLAQIYFQGKGTKVRWPHIPPIAHFSFLEIFLSVVSPFCTETDYSIAICIAFSFIRSHSFSFTFVCTYS